MAFWRTFNRSLAVLGVVALAATPGQVPAQTADSKTDDLGEERGTKAMHGGILPLEKFGGELSITSSTG